MLRRKLLAILGSLVLLLLGVAIAAIFLLQGLLGDLRHVRGDSLGMVDQVSRLSSNVALIQIELYRLQLGSERHLDTLVARAEQIQRLMDEMGKHYTVQDGFAGEQFGKLKQRLPRFFSSVSALATSQDADLARQHNQEALSAAVEMNQAVLEISQFIRDYADAEQAHLISRFRWIVLGLGVAFLVLINASIIILLRAAEMVLRPIDRLVEASRALAEEKFETRVVLERTDEFGELAQAYNSLAENLQASEGRKLEMLGQVALALNHELNNAMAIIELQLELLNRSAKGNQGHEKYLRQIRESLKRMTAAVGALKRIRRIVLTDYVAGVQMLDLEKSSEPEPNSGDGNPQA